MFEVLFTCPCTIASYHAAPLLDERLRYLRHCTQAGVGRATLRQIATHQLHLVRFLGLRKAERVSMSRIEAAAARWLRRTKGRPSGSVRPKTRRVFVDRALRWLRFVDLLAEPCKVRHTAGFRFAPVQANGSTTIALLVLDLELAEGFASKRHSSGVAQVVFKHRQQCSSVRNVIQGVSWHWSHAARELSRTVGSPNSTRPPAAIRSR